MLTSPLKHARGLGSAKDGTHHWWVQRVSAVALIPLVLWFAFGIACASTADYASFTAWVAKPWNTVLLVTFLVTVFYHSQLGVQVVIEDYVGGEFAKISSLMLMKFAHAILGLASVIAVLKISFGS